MRPGGRATPAPFLCHLSFHGSLSWINKFLSVFIPPIPCTWFELWLGNLLSSHSHMGSHSSNLLIYYFGESVTRSALSERRKGEWGKRPEAYPEFNESVNIRPCWALSLTASCLNRTNRERKEAFLSIKKILFVCKHIIEMLSKYCERKYLRSFNAITSHVCQL